MILLTAQNISFHLMSRKTTISMHFWKVKITMLYISNLTKVSYAQHCDIHCTVTINNNVRVTILFCFNQVHIVTLCSVF